MILQLNKFVRMMRQIAKVSAFAFCGLCLWTAAAKAQEITAIDFNGDLIGKVIPDGNVVSFDNRLIGNVTADSLIVNFDGDLIGGVVPQGIAIANDTSLLGKVSNDGTVRQPSGKVIGKVLPNGLVVNDFYDIIGAVLFPGLIYNDEGKTVGRLTGDGLYTNLKGQSVGFITPDGFAYRRVGDDYLLDGKLISSKMVVSLNGDFLGSVVPGGEVSDFEGRTIGFIKANGYVYNEKNEIIGHIVKSSYAFDNFGRYLGYVTYNGEVINKGKSFGRQRADGSIANAKGEVIGFALDIASTATNLEGKYIGRIMPGGTLARAKEAVGQVGARGDIVGTDGKISGRIISAGPVFDYRAALIGHALSNGQLIALSGNSIGKIIGQFAFNLQGKLMGATSTPSLIINADNTIAGLSGINSTFKSGEIIKQVSPFGYVFTADGSYGGMSTALLPVYNQIGAAVARIGLNGSVISTGNAEIGKLTQSGMVVDERNLVLGSSLKDNYAVNVRGDVFGQLAQDNLIIDNNKKIVAKITPDKAVIKTAVQNSPDLMPKEGTAFDRFVAIDFLGSLLGYADVSGRVLDFDGTSIGRIVDNAYVLDNNNILNGYAIAQNLAINKKCNLVGIITPRGEVRNFKNIFIGRILTNGQVIDETGNVIAHAANSGVVIDYNGNTIATMGGNGQIVNYNGDVLGCVDFKNQIRNNNNAIIAAPVEYVPVIDFQDKIIGRVTMDGQVTGLDNQNLGYMQPDGNVNSRTGAPLGNLFRYTIAFDNSNRYLGRVISDGTVRNEKFEDLGHVAFDGTVTKGVNKIGYALYDFYAYNNEFEAVGLIGKDGTVRNFNNKNIGSLQRGFVIAIDDSVVARGNRDFYIRDNSNMILGELGLNGEVRSSTGEVVGKLGSTGEITDKNGMVIANARPLQYYSRIMAAPSSEIVVDDSGRIIGRLDGNGNVINSQGQVIATRDEDGNILSQDGAVVGKVIDPNIVYDNEGKIIGRVQPNGDVVNKKGEVIGHKDKSGNIVDGLGRVIGKLFDINKVYDEKGKLVGYVKPDGTVVDENGKEVGKLNEDGTVTNANNAIIGGVGSDWYERIDVIRPRRPSVEPQVGTPGGGQASSDNKYRRSLNIALSPDGTYIGDIMDDGSVVDKKGRVIGHKTPDGLVIDDSGTLIGIEEIKKPAGGDIFVPAGTFGQGAAYGTGVGPGDNLGPGGGYGPGERYNAQRSAALSVAQGERRQNMQVGKISSGIRKEAFDGMQKDWSEQGIEKSLSSWRVDMSEMILADKPIPAVLARSIDSNNPTPVTAFVERNVYAEEGRNILIPAGSRFIGEFGGLSPTSEASSESGKVQISWQRLIRPDGSMFKFDGLTADAQGRGGALGYLDKQLFKRYSMPVMTSVLTNAMAYMMAPSDSTSGESETPKQQAANDARQNFLDQMNQMFEQILQDKSNITAMSYVPAGTRIIIFPKVDLWLRNVDSDKEDDNQRGNARVLINDEERLKGKAPGQQTNGVSGTGGSAGGQVSYEEDGGTEKPKSAPLIADRSKKEKPSTRPVVVPPPPPSSSTGGSSSGNSSSGSSYTPPASSGSSSSSSSSQSVPQLF